uniref:Uncharacterized protein n=1 Tax=Arundo donax TaxID=35708 RepID=A0A0A9DAM9_ARUDO
MKKRTVNVIYNDILPMYVAQLLPT